MEYYVIAYKNYEIDGMDVELINTDSINAARNENVDYVDIYRSMKIYSIELTWSEYQRLFGETKHTLHEDAHVFKVNVGYASGDMDGFAYENYFGWGDKEEKDKEKSENHKIDIKNIEECDKETADIVKRIVRILMVLPNISEFNADNVAERLRKYINQEDKYKFTVHNIGQGLATSLGRIGEIPFLYFDFGVAYGRNSFTVPTRARLQMQEEGVIIISHIHDDHWQGHTICTDSYKCLWLVPDQVRPLRFNSVLTRIMASGGTVSVYKSSIDIQGIHVCNFHPNSRPVVDFHKTGYGMRIDAKKLVGEQKENYVIYVAGDQHYYHQDRSSLNCLNVLVACHHGGTYGAKKGFSLLSHSVDPIIVYSYGKANTYNHPTKKVDYKTAGWAKEHNTPADGDYIDEIMF